MLESVVNLFVVISEFVCLFFFLVSFPQIYWYISDIRHCLSLKACSVMVWFTYVTKWLQQVQLTSIFSYRYNKRKGKKFSSLVMRTIRIYSLTNFPIYSIAVSSSRALHHIPSTCLSYHWKCVPFGRLPPIPPPWDF